MALETFQTVFSAVGSQFTPYLKLVESSPTEAFEKADRTSTRSPFGCGTPICPGPAVRPLHLRVDKRGNPQCRDPLFQQQWSRHL